MCNILICRCMQKHIQHIKDEWTQFFRKIYLSLYLKGLERVTKGIICERWVGDWTELQHTDPPPTLLATAGFLSRSPGLLNQGLGAQPLLGYGSHSSIFSPTDLNFLSPGLYNNLTSTYFLRASDLYSIQPVDSQDYTPDPLISSTGCTRYLHRCISHLTAWPGRRSICNICSYANVCISLFLSIYQLRKINIYLSIYLSIYLFLSVHFDLSTEFRSKVNRLTKMLSWNVTKWGLFFNIILLVDQALMPNKFHQQQIWCHHIKFSASELLSLTSHLSIYLSIYLSILTHITYRLWDGHYYK